MIASSRARHRRPGISLLEVLISLAIFLMSLVAIGGLVDFGSDQGMAASMQSAGTRLVQSKLAEVEAGAIDVATGGQGTFEHEPEWNWAVESGTPPYPNVYPITIRVWRDTGNGQMYEVTLSQMVFDPAQMGQAAEAQPPQPADSTTTTGGN